MNKITSLFMNDKLIYCIISAIIIGFFTQINFSNSTFAVIATFAIIGIISFYNCIKTAKNITIRRLFYIFIFIFMFIAPIQQYSCKVVFWKKNWGLSLIYTDKDYFYANILIIVSIVFFEIGYNRASKFKFYFKKEEKLKLIKTEKKTTSTTLFFIAIISFLCFGYLIATGRVSSGLETTDSNLVSQSIKIIKYMPLNFLVLYLIQMKNLDIKNKQMNYFFILIQLVEVCIIFFPLGGSSSRFLMMGAYLMIISVCFSKSTNKSVYFLIFIVGFFFVFSAFNIFKYGGTASDFVLLKQVDFVNVDFDAYQMLMATMKYTDENGFCFCGNFLSGFLCMFPRSIFNFRMEATGALVVRYYSSGFENVSCPIFAEFYFALGWFGVIIGSLLLGKIIKIIDSFDNTSSTLKRSIFCLFSGLSIYIFRGAFLPTWAFTTGLLISLFIAYWISQLQMKYSHIK